MPSGTKTCRVCGKTYTECNVNRHFDGNFHWREVACSPECGEIYLQRIAESRSDSSTKKTKSTRKTKTVVSSVKEDIDLANSATTTIDSIVDEDKQTQTETPEPEIEDLK